MIRVATAAALGCAALGCAAFAARVDAAWLSRHCEVPAWYLAAPSWWLPALRAAAACLAVAAGFLAHLTFRRGTAGSIARIGLALLCSVVAGELLVRVLLKPEREQRQPKVEALIGVPDPRLGWTLAPSKTTMIRNPYTGRTTTYAVNGHGDRAAREDSVEDPLRPTVLVTGESTALGHSLQWPDTVAARLGDELGLQVVDVAVSGYASDQAWLRTKDALARFRDVRAVVTFFLPVQIFRNIQDDRPRLALEGDGLRLVPAFRPRIVLRELLVDRLPYLGEGRLSRALAVTRAILDETARGVAAAGATPLFVVPSYGPPRAFDDRPEAWAIRGALGDLPALVVDVDPGLLLPWDGHPDEEGAREIAVAVAAALRRASGSRLAVPP